MTHEEMKKYAVEISNTILEQIIGTTDVSVVMSWGIRGYGAGIVKHNDVKMPCLVLDVSGLVHEGRVLVAYNEGVDTYEVLLKDKEGNNVGDWHEDVYFDDLGSLLDSLIERPADMSDEEYEILSTIDSYIKHVEDEMRDRERKQNKK